MYAFAWYDLIGNGRAGGGLGAVPKSIEYWFGAVLPYWWLLLLLFATAMTALAILWRTVAGRTGARGRGAV